MRRMIGVITVLMMSQAAATAEPQQIDLDVPSTELAATVQINVKPSKGAVLLYTGPSYDKPIRFPGPSSTRVVPTSSRTVRIELVEGAKSFHVKILGHIDGLDGSKIEPPSRCGAFPEYPVNGSRIVPKRFEGVLQVASAGSLEPFRSTGSAI